MKIFPTVVVAGLLLAGAAVELATPIRIGFISDAHAIIGRPLTPLSYAGVARRTAYRGAAITTAAVVTTASVAAASEASAAAVAYAPAPIPAGAVAVGTIVATLPSGCTSTSAGGVEYYLCNGTYYRAAFQGNNLVYVVQNP